jgi:putative lipase involved disintegration of autophagic bodies
MNENLFDYVLNKVHKKHLYNIKIMSHINIIANEFQKIIFCIRVLITIYCNYWNYFKWIEINLKRKTTL